MKTEQTSRHNARGGFELLDPAQMGGLSDAQRDAIARAIVAQGPALMRQGDTQRLLNKVAFSGALAAAAALVVILQSKEPETKMLVPVAAVAPTCSSDATPTPITHEDEDRSSIQVGSHIRAVTARDTQYSIVEAEPCVTRLALNQGTLTLRARDLRGGTVLVDTPHGQVRAESSFLRIVTLASSTSISVVEGEAVMRSVQGAETVAAGRSVRVNREGIQRSAVSVQERKDLLGAFEVPTAALEPVQDAGPKLALARKPRPRAALPETQPMMSATELLGQADTMWRNGDYDGARRAFRAAAQDKGAIGEAAWVRLARLELSAGSHEKALTALKARKSRAGKGTLGAEALWLEAQALERAGRGADAMVAAETLLRDYPSSPQAPAARRLVAKGKVP